MLAHAIQREDTMQIRWTDLNNVLRGTEDEKLLRKMLAQERNGPNRGAWVIRIHSRLNRVRRIREQQELMKPAKRKKAA